LFLFMLQCSGESCELALEKIELEAQRLRVAHDIGKNLPEDFAVDRICAGLEQFRQKNWPANISATAVEPPKDATQINKLIDLRIALSADQRDLSVQQQKLAQAQLQLEQAKKTRLMLAEELETERDTHRRCQDGHARRMKETNLRTQLALTRCRSFGQELALLNTAVDGTGTMHDDTWTC